MTQYPERPTFLLSKGDRKGDKGITLEDLEPRYLAAYCSRFQWDDLPDGCPIDFVERTMFWHGGVSGKKVTGLGACLMGASPTSLTLYNTPAKWRPAGITIPDNATAVGRSINSDSSNPVLWDEMPMSMRIIPYLEIQRKAMNSLNQNLAAMCMPIIIETSPGQELKAQLIKQNLGAGDVYLQCVEKGSLPINAVDLKASDRSQNMLSVLHDADSTILDIMSIRSAMEKASGITSEEATASDQQIRDGLMIEYRKRKEWCNAINKVLGTNISVHCKLLDDEPAEEGGESDGQDGQGNDE